MADMRWTDSQQDAISARRGTVLVARAIQRLTDPENPTSADRMLIVTFTKAAAAEMRARLEARLHQMLRENPGDPHLRRQRSGHRAVESHGQIVARADRRVAENVGVFREVDLNGSMVGSLKQHEFALGVFRDHAGKRFRRDGRGRRECEQRGH